MNWRVEWVIFEILYNMFTFAYNPKMPTETLSELTFMNSIHELVYNYSSLVTAHMQEIILKKISEIYKLLYMINSNLFKRFYHKAY